MPSRRSVPIWGAVPAIVRNAVLDALAVVAPVNCAGCGRADRGLCDECRAELLPAVTPRRLLLGIVAYTALRYEGVVRQALLAFKEEGRTDVARALAAPLTAAIARALVPGEASTGGAATPELIAVPSTRAAWRRRGYDPVALLCRRAGYSLARELVHDRRTESQKLLAGEDRESNLHQSMRARRRLDGRTFVLIDDVLTTGATLREATRAVQEAGGTVVAAVALAFTPRLFTQQGDQQASRESRV